MQIIWNQEAAQTLSRSHTVLELETFDVEGQAVTGWCVVPAEKIVMEMSQLEFNQQQHRDFIAAYKSERWEEAKELAQRLTGRFGGELDSFYTILLEKINNQLTNK